MSSEGRLCMCSSTLLSVLNCAVQAIYMFYALAIVCDDYFVPSLEKISEVRKRHRPVIRYHFLSFVGSFLIIPILFWASLFCFYVSRTCSSVKMWLGRHLWRQAALLQSFLLLSLVSSFSQSRPSTRCGSFEKVCQNARVPHIFTCNIWGRLSVHRLCSATTIQEMSAESN